MKKKYVLTVDFNTEEYGERDMDVIIHDIAKFIHNFTGIWDTKVDKVRDL